MGNNQKHGTLKKKILVFLTAILLSFVLVIGTACDLSSIFSPPADPPSTQEPSDDPSKNPPQENPKDDPSDEPKDDPKDDPSDEPKDDPKDDPSDSTEPSELSIHFLDVGNKYAGDSVLIKVGNTEVLIDAGSRQNSAATLVNYISDYCTDGVLEYVIATHADQDHIAGFVGLSGGVSIFSEFECKTIIDFPRTDKSETTASGARSLYGKYVDARNAEVAAGAVHYTALDCWNAVNGAKRSYQLGEGVTMSILYNYYYEYKSSDENNYSVCLLITQGENNYLFTGDLEESGEKYLVQYNDLPHCVLYKAGHHGSPTSSNDVLLSVIQPEYVCVCCCAGSTEYTTNKDNTFPSQAMINRVGKYTKNIYVTNLVDATAKDGYVHMNGNIVFWSNGKDVTVTGSNNSTILKETAWFQENRTWPADGVE